MNDGVWYETYFGSDYLEIHRDDLTADLTRSQALGVVSLLSLEPGARILDLACGHGRHSVQLARLGFDVTGYDLSEVFLERAQADADSEGVSVRWMRGDMRELPFEREFDAVINMFTAFGYFDEPKDDLRVLQGVRQALTPQGRFLLETIHRDALFPRFEFQSWNETSEGLLVFRKRQLDLATDVLHEEAKLIRPDGSRVDYQLRLRLRSLSGYIALFREAGLEPVAWYGGLDGSELQLNSWRLALIAGVANG